MTKIASSASSRLAPLALLAALLVTLGACKHSPLCANKDAEHLSAQSVPPLRAPPGLTTPDRSAALVVPEASAQAAAPRRTGTSKQCLEQPPSYFGTSGVQARTPEEVVASWAQAWAERDADTVAALYSVEFQAPTEAGRGPWLQQRREEVATGPVPEPKIKNLKVSSGDADRRTATFVQYFGKNSIRKEMTLIREGVSWRIVSEKVIDVGK